MLGCGEPSASMEYQVIWERIDYLRFRPYLSQSLEKFAMLDDIRILEDRIDALQKNLEELLQVTKRP